MPQETGDNLQRADVLQMTTQLVAAYVGNNNVGEAQIPDVIRSVYVSLSGLNGHAELTDAARRKPAVPIKKSITAEYLVCLEDGKKFKILKRHLRTAYGLSPDEYRAKWGLGPAYPMVAPNYAKRRSAFAKKIGLGKRRA
jgi:predicted transcriptional regulator